ncbi:MAG: hypothetical protein A2W31_15295 [Planctomycetes bacterium RBG_16_64_10]|nr:MAG: hypothetical protein A2W31_15295 [Planctomycetes bacterium RBG_16_64_10]
MILDRLEHWCDYGWPNDRFRLAFEYLEKLDPDLEDGRHPIDGDHVFNLMQTYQTKPRQGELFESHREYADIQVVVRGAEQIWWAPRSSLQVVAPMANDKELQAMISAATTLVLSPGLFAVFFPPDDAHAPCLVHQQISTVRKACIKVRM